MAKRTPTSVRAASACSQENPCILRPDPSLSRSELCVVRPGPVEQAFRPAFAAPRDGLSPRTGFGSARENGRPTYRTNGPKSENKCNVYPSIRRSIHGSSTNAAPATAAKRRTAASVFSCSEVRTCTMFSSRLTTIATASRGNDNSSAISSIPRPSPMICSKVISSSKTAHQRSHQQIPSVHHHEQQNLQRRRNHHRRQLQHAY